MGRGGSIIANYHLHAKIITRSTGRSIVAAAAYRAGEALRHHLANVTHDYSRRSGVVHREILLPPGAPAWMGDRSTLWNAVEAVEKRKDAQLGREIEVSIPRELSPDQRLELVRRFIVTEFAERGMTSDFALHTGMASDGGEHPHAHILLTLRPATATGFGQKHREWNDRNLLNSWRERWAEYANDALERAGHSDRVDHRSYAERGIDRRPQTKLGPAGHRVRRAAAGGKPIPAGYQRRLERAAGVWMENHARTLGGKYVTAAAPAKALVRPLAEKAMSSTRIGQLMAVRARAPTARSVMRISNRTLTRTLEITDDLTRE